MKLKSKVEALKTAEEQIISKEEGKRRALNNKLKDVFERVASNPAKKITQKQWYERLFRTVPVTFEPYTTNENSMF